MSNSKKIQEQELKKMEDAAYFELCQIIAEAMQYQDIELLNARIAYWKNKYSKLLNGAASPNFKKKIEFLLNQYYSSVTQYIYSQLKFKEEQKIKNQAKAMRELYLIIKSTKDLPLLKKKIDKWKNKYPISSFLNMYQKRIRSYIRQKNLEENAFAQEEAFSDLVSITKKYATIDELDKYIYDWEKKYSINNNFKIDDFIKHQSEVKRYISPEFLQSIAREDTETKINTDLNKEELVEEYNKKSFSDLSVQASAYSSLLSISKSPNNINEMFKWVYKNSHIKFNDKYKEMILRETYLYYSPTYLRKLDVPDMDFSNNSLSFDEYKNMNDIKKYAIISYFNLLLPPNKAVANNYFTKYIHTIYSKSERAKMPSEMETPTLSTDEFLSSGLEISLDVKTSEDNKNLVEELSNDKPENTMENPDTEVKPIVDLTKIEEVLYSELDNKEELSSDTVLDKTEEYNFIQNNDEETLDEENSKLVFSTVEEKVDLDNTDIDISKSAKEEKEEENLDYTQIVVLSPLFFAAINDLDKQAKVVEHIEQDTTNYIESQKTQENLLYEPTKIKSNE